MSRQDIISLAHQLEEEDNRAFDLWTHLPSHEAAHKHHGDNGDLFTPSVVDILIEATFYISYLNQNIDGDLQALSDGRKELFSCPCGKNHDLK